MELEIKEIDGEPVTGSPGKSRTELCMKNLDIWQKSGTDIIDWVHLLAESLNPRLLFE